jgi:hypothetical protein
MIGCCRNVMEIIIQRRQNKDNVPFRLMMLEEFDLRHEVFLDTSILLMHQEWADQSTNLLHAVVLIMLIWH